jgi:hypothetical protein
MSAETFQAEVIAELPNLGVANGAPYQLLRADDGAFALAQKIGDRYELMSDWVVEQKVLDGAARVLCRDPAAMTNPKALQHIALALVGIFVTAQKRREAAGK